MPSGPHAAACPSCPTAPRCTSPWLRRSAEQGRDREAADGLRRRLTARPDDAAARRELARLDRSLDSVAGLAHRTSAHFSVRFEGEADDALGRALLELLEEKYDMLEDILDCEPNRQIPIILLPRQTYSSVSSAPDWAADTTATPTPGSGSAPGTCPRASFPWISSAFSRTSWSTPSSTRAREVPFPTTSTRGWPSTSRASASATGSTLGVPKSRTAAWRSTTSTTRRCRSSST